MGTPEWHQSSGDWIFSYYVSAIVDKEFSLDPIERHWKH